MSRRKTLALYLGLAALCLAAARPLEARLVGMRQSSGMAAASEERPGARAAFVRCLGGLRGILTDLVWMRAVRMQEEGRFYEIVALLDGLLEMQPHFASVWVFQAHVLAFDFGSPSVETDPAEAFRWIERGIAVLERGIERNPSSSLLDERLAEIYLFKLSPASSSPEWRLHAAMLNDQLAGRDRLPGQEPSPLVRTINDHLARLAEHDRTGSAAPDNYTTLRLARWHFLQTVAKPDVSSGRKLLCQRLAIRCLERMGSWIAAEAEWRELYEAQGRKDLNGFFREFMRSVVCEQLLMGRTRESREAFSRMQAYFPDAASGYREFLAAEVRNDLARGHAERSRKLYQALRAAEPGETRSYEAITGPAAPQQEPPGTGPKSDQQ